MQEKVEVIFRATGVDQVVNAFKSASDASERFGNTSKNSGEKTSSFTGKVKSFIGTAGKIAGVVGITKLVSAGFDVIKSSIGGAVKRVDTLNQFPRVMEAMGFSTKESETAVRDLADGIEGLPTPLDEVASTAQRIGVMTGDLDGAVKTTLALNDAFIASGSGQEKAKRGMDQYLKMLATGKVDMNSWTTLQETMGLALQKTAEEFGFTGEAAQTDLYNALKKGDITFDQFNKKMIEISKATGGFHDMAIKASEGIATSWANVKTAVVKGLADMINAIDKGMQDAGLGSIAENFDRIKGVVRNAFASINSYVPPVINALASLFNYVRNSTAFNTLIEAIKMVIQWFKEMTMNFLQSQAFETIKNAIKSVADAIASIDFVQVITEIGNFIDKWSPLIAGIMGAIGAFKLITTVAPIVVSAFKSFMIIKKLISSVGLMQTAFTFLAPAIGALNLPLIAIVAVIGAVIAVGVLLWKNWDTVKEKASALGQKISEVWTNIVEWTKEKWNAMVEKVSEVFAKMGESVSNGINSIKQFFAEGFNNMVADVRDAWNKITEVTSTVWNGIVTIISGVWSILVEMVKGWGELLRSVFEGIWTAVKMVAQVAWEGIKNVIYVVIGLIAVVVQTGFNMIKENITVVWEGIKNVTSTVWNAIKGFLSTVWQAIWGVIEPVVTRIKEIISRYFELIKLSITNVMNAIKNVFTTVWNAIVAFITPVLDAIKLSIMNVWNGIKVGLTTIMNAIKTVMTTVWNAIKTAVSTVTNAIKTAVTTAWEAIKSAITTVLNAIKSVVTSVWNAIKEYISSALNTIRSTASSVWESIRSVISTAVNNIKATVTSVFNAVRAFVSSVFNSIRSTASSVWNSIWSTVTSIANRIKSSVTQTFNSLRSAVTSAFSRVKSAVTQGMTNAYNAVKNFFGRFRDAGKNIVGSIADGIKGAIGKVTGAISDVTSKIRRFLPFSPAKEGPLRDLNKLNFGGTISDSIDKAKGKVRSSMNKLVQIPDLDAGELGYSVAQANRRLETDIDYHVESTDREKKPAHINLTLGGRTYRAFVEDISNMQGEATDLNDTF